MPSPGGGDAGSDPRLCSTADTRVKFELRLLDPCASRWYRPCPCAAWQPQAAGSPSIMFSCFALC